MSPRGASPGLAQGTYVDEEDCLPFPIFIAEFELLVGNSKRGKPDGVQLLELLQKLVATIPRTDKSVLKQHQRQCETMLYDVLAHGVGAAVRRLIYACFSSLYAHGDSVSIYTRVSSLLAYLSSKEGMSRSTAETIRVGLLDFLAHLNAQYGRMLASSAQESMGIASRTVSKYGNQAAVRCAALRLATAVVRGLSPQDRSAASVHADAWAVVQKNCRDRTSEEVRGGCLALLGALCGAGGGVLWREGAHGAEEALRHCLVLADDPLQAVRDAAWRALGELAAASRGSAASEAVSGEKRPAKKAAAERVVGGCVRACLVTPLVEAAVNSRREACLAVSGAWMSYVAALPRHREGGDHTADLMEVAAMLINAVSEAGRLAAEARAATPADSPAELGAGLAGGELPPLQACALYVLRRGVMSGLAEAAQRKLLERLANTLDKRLATPAAVVVLEALATLLEAVGEVTDDTAAALERLLQPFITSSSSATRQQAAAALAALAAAHPAAAARMLSGCLDTVATCAAQMAATLSPAASGSMDAASLSRPSTPRNGGSGGGEAAAGSNGVNTVASVSSPPHSSAAGGRLSPAQRSLMDTCHGAALAAARLLLTAARAPLGCPARLQRRALALAEDLVTGPGPQIAASRAICREVGFLLLGSLCSLGVPQATRGSEEMAALWRTALGETARKELDERSYLRPGGDLDLAVQLWWRAIALQALSACIAASASAPQAAAQAGSKTSGGGAVPYRSISSMPSLSLAGPSFSMRVSEAGGLRSTGSTGSGLGSGMDPTAAAAVDSSTPADELASQLGPLVLPLLDLLDTQGYLQDPVRVRGGPGGVLAGASAMFILSLLELHLRAPGGRVVPSAPHVAALVKACLRPFRLGLAPAPADALTLCALRGLLSADDAPLGPWPPGSDAHEEALRTYTGSRGAPHLPPWLTAEEHAALLTGALAAAPGTSISNAAASTGFSSSSAYSQTSGVGSLATDAGQDTDVSDAAGAAAAVGALGAAATSTSNMALGGGVGSAAAELAHATYPQPLGLEAALLSAQLVLLGRLLGASPVQQQLQILEVILSAVQAAKVLARQSRDAAACRRLPLGVAAAVAALAAYGPAAMAARRSRAPLDPSDKVPEKLLVLAQALMPDEHPAAPDAAPLARASAELFAASAATGTDPWALRVVRSLASEAAASAAEGRDSERRGVVAVALGAAHRARGGLAMQGAVAGSVEGLVAAASRPGSAAGAAWVLHGLWLVASSSGGAFVPRVRTSLQLGQELLVSSYEAPALRAACARLANAAVAVLGPEFSLGSAVYARAKSLVAASGGVQESAASAAVGGGGGNGCEGSAAQSELAAAASADGGDGGLGMVQFVQQIILFAPHAVPPAKHVPLLLSHLLSRQPDLRAASALTLRHLAERSADSLSPAEAAPLLFAALDSETDARIAGQLRATLSTVLTASASSQPSFWLSLLSDVVFATGPPSAAAAAAADADAPRGGDEDDDDDKYGQPATPAAAPSSASAGGAGTDGGAKAAAAGGVSGAKALRSVREVLTAPHLRTRHLAANCLLHLVRVCVASDEGHRDPSALEWRGSELHHSANTATPTAANGGVSSSSSKAHGATGPEGTDKPRDLLITKLQALVDVGFKLATCPLESLRPHGVRMLTLLVLLFGDVPDPLLQGSRLMEQYQAQVVSALRSSLGARQAATGGLSGFSSGSVGAAAGPTAADPTPAAQHPLLQIAGGVLATCFLESGLAAGDAVVMRRLMELLSAPLAAWDSLRYEAYAEWVGARARVELLRAHAQCAAIAAAAAARGDALCAGIVAKAHEPHAARLQALWALLLQDHAVLCSQQGEVLATYRSPLLDSAAPESPPSAAAAAAAAAVVAEVSNGAAVDAAESEEGRAGGGGTVEANGGFEAAATADAGDDGSGGVGGGLTPALAAVLRPVYAAACPAALAALAGSLPPAAQLAADEAARTQFRRVLEVGLMLLTDASARVAHATLGITRCVAGDSVGHATAGVKHRPHQNLHHQQTQHSSAASTAAQATASTDGYSHLRDSVTRLTGVLRALQRFLAPSYIAAAVTTGAASPNGSSSSCPLAASSSIAPAAAAANVTLKEPLIPAAVLRDILGLISSTAAHVLLPLQWALLGAAIPASMGALLPGLALPCCAVVRELCDAAPEELFWGLAAAEPSPESLEPPPAAAAAAAVDACGEKTAPAANVRCSGAATVPAACVEAILLLASVCAPYSYDASTPSASEPSPGASFPSWLLPARGLCCSSLSSPISGESSANTGVTEVDAAKVPGCVQLPVAAPEHAAVTAQCIMQLLAAAQLLVRRAPWPALEPHVGPLLELPLRLILTSAPGAPAVAAAQRYLENAVAALVTRAAAQAQQPAAEAASPAAYAASAVIAVAGAAELHLKALRRSRRRGSSSSSGSGGSSAGHENSTTLHAAATSLLLGRFAALVTPLLASAALLHGTATEQEPLPVGATPPAQASSSASKGSGLGTSGPGSPRPRRSSSAGGSGGASGSGSAESPTQHRRSSRSGGGRVAACSPGSSPPSPIRGGGANSGGGGEGTTSGSALGDALAARNCAVAVVAAALAPEVPSSAAVAVLEAARAAVQEVAAEDPSSARGRWGRLLLCTLTPPAVARVGTLLAEARQPLSGDDQSLVAECVKLLVVVGTLAGPSHGGAVQEGVMQVLVPLLLELAAPAQGTAAVTPALRDMAVKLITTLPASAAGTAFKTHLAAQPSAAKLRLSSALREAAAAAAAAAAAGAAGAGGSSLGATAAAATLPTAAAAPGSAGGSARRPTIQLKTTFALPLPGK